MLLKLIVNEFLQAFGSGPGISVAGQSQEMVVHWFYRYVEYIYIPMYYCHFVLVVALYLEFDLYTKKITIKGEKKLSKILFACLNHYIDTFVSNHFDNFESMTELIAFLC